MNASWLFSQSDKVRKGTTQKAILWGTEGKGEGGLQEEHKAANGSTSYSSLETPHHHPKSRRNGNSPSAIPQIQREITKELNMAQININSSP